MDDDTFQRRMNFAAGDLKMLQLGGKALAKALEDCRAKNPELDDTEIEAYRARVSKELQEKMEAFLLKVLKDDGIGVADIRMLQRKHFVELDRNMPRELLVQAIASGSHVIDQVDWTCPSHH